MTRQTEEFKPIDPKNITFYTCGTTVYFYQHIGNFSTFAMADFLHRTLLFNGLKVSYIMNLTDVGHLTGDNLGDADTGEDRLEKAAEKEGRSAKEIANFYIQDFSLNIQSIFELQNDAGGSMFPFRYFEGLLKMNKKFFIRI